MQMSRIKKIRLYIYILAAFGVVTLIGGWRSWRIMNKAQAHVNTVQALSGSEADTYLIQYYEWATGEAEEDMRLMNDFLTETKGRRDGQFALGGIIVLMEGVLLFLFYRLRDKKE